MQEIAARKRVVTRWRQMEGRVAGLLELEPLADADNELQQELTAEVGKATADIDQAELEAAFTRPLRRPPCHPGYPCRRRRHRVAGLGGEC